MKGFQLEDYLKDYTKDLTEKILKTDFEILNQIAEKLLEAKKNGNTIFTAGNGGSAATASHMANDFTKGCRVYGREGFKTQCLADSNPLITCLANDFSYEDIFSIPLKTLGTKGDILVVFSGSGNSPNIVKAVETARNMGIYTIGFSGRDGGKLKELCHRILIAPTDSMEQIEDMHMIYEHNLSCAIQEILKDQWGMEIVRYPSDDMPIKSAIFDFDGTVSLIREGWQDVMIPYFTEELQRVAPEESLDSHRDIVREFVDLLTGKQTIFQCQRLAEEVAARGGNPKDPLEYKKEYLRRLEERIAHRHQELKSGADAEKYRVKGTISLLQGLRDQGIKLYLASGTDEEDVKREVNLLGLTEYFDGGIWGAQDHIIHCSKELVIKRIIEENQIYPEQLVSFGDGYVEIELVKNIGGFTFGVATDEAGKKGIDLWKRDRLLSAGADVIIPNFEEAGKILNFLMLK